ncbi:MAG: HEAT repeat domain-containing protein [Leptolyngbyaceae cyanobacterium CSU_1_4]|nr:HEAT repeat domain-containing protein [Leptolyngbyaceae cyanobacterium CSU_1_4]
MSPCSKRSLLMGAFCLSLALPSPVFAAKTSAPPAPQNWTGMIMTALVVTSTVGGVAYTWGYGQGRNQSSTGASDQEVDLSLEPRSLSSMPLVPVLGDRVELDPQKQSDLCRLNSTTTVDPTQLEATAIETPVSETTRLAKIDGVAELIQDLQNPDPSKRRKAIWDLGQHGDSRAVLPLVDLMRDSDSSQRSLILAAVSEIGMKTLKPMNRALMLSLQDRSSDVRKNGIRDVTRIYELLGQVSQLLQHAASDPDSEVQETATWALTQLNQIHPSFLRVDDLHQLSGGSLKELGSGKNL